MSDNLVPDLEESIAQLQAAVTAQEALRPVLGDAAVDAAIGALREKLAVLEKRRGARPAQPAERKPVTILFGDLVGFTSLAELLDPEVVRQLINACFETLKVVLDRYGGRIDKYIGDEIMALFGAPLELEDHAERALRAALELQTAAQDFSREMISNPQLAHLPPELRLLRLHIGINTGLVIAGEVGAQAYQQYTVTGDAVNMASRLTEICEPGQIMVGEATYQLTAPLFDFEPLPPLKIKGKRDLQQAYRLLGLRARPGKMRGLESLGLSAPLIGRDGEFQRLQTAVSSLRLGSGGVVAIIGEAGIGKSRLVAEVHQQSLAAEGALPLAWHEGRCLSYGETLSYHPFLALLRDLVGAPPKSNAAALAMLLGAFLQELFPNQAETRYPYLAELLGLPMDAATREWLNGLAGESRQWQTFRAVEDILSGLARRVPTVIVLEDLHWADPTSLALLEDLAPLSERLPLLFLLVLRPFSGEDCDHLLNRLRASGSLPFHEIALSPLSEADSRTLIAHLLIIEALPEAMRELILGRAEGNPFFLEEILRSLISQGVLQREGDSWRPASGVHHDQVNLPATLQGIILARLDRLNADTKAILQMAAVIGRIFWYRVLNYIASIEQRLERALDNHLLTLEQVELIRQTRHDPDLEYIFKHVLIQDAAYQSLLIEQRRQFHRRVAEALEKIFAGSPEEQYGLLAHHYEAAGEVERAIAYLQIAGDRARHAYALAEARDFYQRALALLPAGEEARQRALHLDLGLVNLTLGDFKTAGEHYAAAFCMQKQPDAGQAQASKTYPLRVVWETPPRSLEPSLSGDMSTGQLIQQLYAGLVEYDEELNILPDMAERWEVDAEGRRYRFYLRPEARWSDGAPLTAHDFVFAWQRWLSPDLNVELSFLFTVFQGASEYLSRQTTDPETIGVRALDDHTLEIELTSPLAYFLPMLTSTFFPLPRHCWPAEGVSLNNPLGLVTNGAFRLAGWQRDQSVTLERNPFYCGVAQGNVDTLEITFTPRSDRQIARYINDQADIFLGHFENTPDVMQQIPLSEQFYTSAVMTFYIGLMAVPPLNDDRVRKALILAQNRSRLAGLPHPQGTHARGGYVPAGMPGYTPELSMPYAPEQARALLKEAGYSSGADLPPLELLETGDRVPGASQLLAEQWQENLGIKVQLEKTNIAGFMRRFRTNQPPHLYSMSWIADYVDPHSFLADGALMMSITSPQEYWNRINEASRLFDARRRMALYHEADRYLIEQAFCIPISYERYSVLVKPWVKHYPMLPVAYLKLKNVVVNGNTLP